MTLFTLLLRTSRKHFLLAVVLGLLSGLANARLISLINEAISGDATATGPGLPLFVAVVSVALGTRLASQMVLGRLNHGTLHRLRVGLSQQAVNAPLRGLEHLGEHRLMGVLKEDAFTISQALVQVPTMFVNASLVTGCLLYLGWLSGRAFLAFGLVLALGLTGLMFLQSRSRDSLMKARGRLDEMFGHFRALWSGAKELKLHRRRGKAFMSDMLEPTSGFIRDMLLRTADVNAVSTALASLLVFAIIGLLLFVFPAFGALERSTLVGYTLVVLYLQQPLDSIISLTQAVLRADVAIRNVERLGMALTEGAEPAGSERPEPQAFQRLRLAGITHSYHRENEDTRFTLGPIHLELVPGEILFIVGGNGSGKTTLAKLLTGLYAPESGEVLLDGEPVTDTTRGHYRQLFSSVFFDFHLFENLLGLAAPELEPRARGLLTRLRLDRKVRLEDGRLSTTSLSTGQRKRLALLTAYLENRPIYLFDEWAADQDPVFKDVFYRELLPELKQAGKTVVVISHDDRYFSVADRLLRLEDGRIVEPVPAPVVQRVS
ncbi:cyclic peptide export ABC transporter [Pyxidicoccus fallax]|uniref:Cyclic peptide export ABC transporter n=1 Tax=Pyxidicoccus fallax TaxID=394095 RepID=A0A848LXT0_9BACT|nr:cyclic peptide export ABC transporter [Pyxidicoccus fallax]NMO22183.1 cyclic peptide export ABC transporter [Pyxidicoccus fallax]NPC84130.1 cyclic peptide export ABC transporter [Pyxidicoccus fallax]